MTTEFSIPIRVYIEDTDAGGIVYYINYLKYFERARTEFMRTIGYEKAAFLSEDLMFVVTDAQVQYKQPARLDDIVQATAAVTCLSAVTLAFEQRVKRDNDVLAEGKVTVAMVSISDRKPRRLPKTLRNQLVD